MKHRILKRGIALTAMLVLSYLGMAQCAAPADAENGATIGGAVFGGGRKADVDGNTYTAVVNAKTIGAVFGGNDIAGTVNGTDGAFLWIGKTDAADLTVGSWTVSGTTAYNLKIGDVYGGGNGYYIYPNPIGDVVDTGEIAFTTTAAYELKYHHYVTTEGVTTDEQVTEETLPAGTYTIPTVAKTKITVASTYTFIDSLFGGAKNAFVDPTPSSTAADLCADIAVNDGTIYSLFGGNNYGGTIGAYYLKSGNSGYDATDATYTNTTNIAVAATTLAGTTTEACLGITHGIKYLFGGGNRVSSPIVTVAVAGGQIDTAFAGGNSATVTKTTFTLATGTASRIYGTAFTDGATITTAHSGTITGSTANTATYPFDAMGGRIVDGAYATVAKDATNVYNIRTLFGGNNAADMYCLPVVVLTSGGVGTVYGGGNAGDMKYSGNYATRAAHYPELYPTGATWSTGNVALGDTVISTLVKIGSNDLYADFIYCGCQKASVDYDTYVQMTAGHVGHIYGGCNISGDVGSYRTKDINYPKYDLNGNLVSGEQVTVAANALPRVFIAGGYVFGNVFAGSNGYYHCNDITLYVAGHDYSSPENYVGARIPTANNTYVKVNGGQVYGNVYGGGNLANVGYYKGSDGQYQFLDEAHTCYRTNTSGVREADYNNGFAEVEISSNPFIGGNVFAGGNMASIFGIANITVKDSPTIDGDVYGGNDKLGHVQSLASHWLDGTHQASDGNTLLTNANASAYVLVTGTPKIHAVYGGGNGDYTYSSDNMCYTNESDKPIQASSFVDINIDAGGHITNVFGGGNGVTVADSVTVLINATVAGSDGSLSSAMVDTVFGGCNKAAMAAVPNIVLTKGRVGDVYGGGNAGDMNGTRLRGTYADISACVFLDNSDIQVDGTLYGGCNQADVTAGTLVYVASGQANVIFGGNNISGDIGGQTHVVVAGGVVHQVYGGSNGYYTYNGGKAYPYGTTDFVNTASVGTGAVPNCGNTEVLLKAGKVNGNIYGGGYAGTCTNTLVDVTGTAQLTGDAIYGGGRGDDGHLGYCSTSYPHLGGVTGTAHVVLNSMNEASGTASNIKKVYGGGDAGDAANTNVVLNATCEHHFTHLYAGCNAADVSGTAKMVLNGKVMTTRNADTIYGGNDVAGNVNISELTINSGKYSAAFGAGNGDYNYKKKYMALHGLTSAQFDAVACWDSIPANRQVLFTINDKSATGLTDTRFEGYVYGGGNMGLVGDRTISSANAVTADQYGLIRLNIHGGYFSQRVFAGARGKSSYLGKHDAFFNMSEAQGLQLVYGLKEVNMDGGKIMLSLHGGSEFINDGYPYECKGTDYKGQVTSSDATDNTTMRPSSIINLMGGTVTKSLYGGGFEGTIYGSVYVNVGKAAIENCEVWTKQYGTAAVGHMPVSGTGVNFATYKPVTDGTGTAVTDLKRNDIYLQASVYGGSDWGDAGKKAVFSTQGVYGGETNVYIDGDGYVTTSAGGTGGKVLSLTASIYGAGTSTEGGDVNRKIMLYNFSSNECLTTDRTLQSIQRADTVMLDHTYITLSGAQDAYFAYPSQNYSLCRIRNFIMRDDNYLVLSSPAIYIDTVESLKRTNAVSPATYALCPASDNQATTHDNSYCDRSVTTDCPILDATGNRNVLMINGGTYMSVLGYKDTDLTDNIYTNNNTTYGPMLGYCYLGSVDNTQVFVYARSKRVANTTEKQNNGFWSLCGDFNLHSQIDDGAELSYINSNSGGEYRVWRVGDTAEGRVRAMTIVANQNPESYASNNFWLDDGDAATTGNGAWSDGTNTHTGYAYAVASLELPPANGGSFYTISNITVDEDNNGEMHLISAAWDDNGSHTGGSWLLGGESGVTNGKAIETNPSYSFGLKFETKGQFADCPTGATGCNSQAVISGSSTYTYVNGYTSPEVTAGAEAAINTLDFALTYSTDFTRTIIRSVTFTLVENIPNGTDPNTGNTIYAKAPIYVTVNVATVVNDFSDMRVKALAIYNEGIAHKYVRKVVLPATYEQRHLYLTDVKWTAMPTCTGITQPAFYLSDTTHNNATAYTDVNGETHATAKVNKTTFAVTMQPSESVGEDMSNSLGWYAKEGELSDEIKVFDIRNLSDIKEGTTGTTTATNSHSTSLTTTTLPTSGTPTNADSTAWIQSGQSVGILDGRATASVDLTMFYNGNLKYDKCEDLGEVTLTFGYVGPKSAGDIYSTGTFKITLVVWSREGGDTIYLASSAYTDASPVGVQRTASNNDNITLRGYDYEYSHAANEAAQSLLKKGKEPKCYLHTFAEALTPNDPYIEGDVIAIIDEVKLTGKDNYTLHGRDADQEEYGMIQIIRYSGSHYQLPGEYGAYRGPLVTLTDTAQLTLYNVWMNGSGLTRRKGYSTELVDGTAVGGSGAQQSFGDVIYYEEAKRVQDTLFAYAPMVSVQEKGIFTTMSNVRMNNAISNANGHASSSAQQGAAISVVKTHAAYIPRVVLGNNTKIYNNATVNHMVPNSLSATPVRDPGNRGAAVYVNNGQLQIGTTKAGCKVLAKDNFYLWKAPIVGTTTYYDDGADGLAPAATGGALGLGTTAYHWDKTSKGWYTDTAALTGQPTIAGYNFDEIKSATRTTDVETYKYYYYFNFTHFPGRNADTVWNNVYLPRTPIDGRTGDAKEMKDDQTNHLTFVSQLDKGTRVGVSKWFPGGKPSYINEIRDTIGFGYTTASPAIVSTAYENGNFFADSMVYNIDTFYHKYVNHYHIYFHRCATFDYYSENDIAYHWHPDALCPSGTDSLMFHLQKGFLPYTYTWKGAATSVDASGNVQTPAAGAMETMRVKTTVATLLDEADPTTNAALLAAARIDTLNLFNVNMPAGTNEAYYYYTVTGSDLGNCKRAKDAYVKIVKTNATSYTDTANFLERGTDYVVGSQSGVAADAVVPCMDSSLYHYRHMVGGVEQVDHSCEKNKYLRTYKSYELIASVKPDANYGYIYHVTKNALGQDVFTKVPTAYGGLTNPVLLCPGDVVDLYTVSVQDNGIAGTPYKYEFLYWNFDLHAPQRTQFVMPARNEEVSAYYGPKDYWYQTVTALPSSYDVSYHGNVTIGDANALAWLISTVNGLNFQQAQTFVFDTIILTASEYDMSAHKWTPLGNINHPFRGTFVSAVPAGSTIKGVFCKEDTIPYVGLFGNLDSARIGSVNYTGLGNDSTITLRDSYFKGRNYAGALSAWATNKTVVNNCKALNITIIANNAMGGAFGHAENTTIKNCTVGDVAAGPGALTGESIYFLGSSVYLGGVCGQSKNVTVSNNSLQDINATDAYALYFGGITGQNLSTPGSSPSLLARLFGRGNRSVKAASGSSFVNNYVNLRTADNAFRVGGLVGDASNAMLRNNYAYGDIAATNIASSLVAIVGDDVHMDHCYYNYDMGHATSAIGSNDYATNVSDTSAFTGGGSQVKTTSRVEGLNNVTVLMNRYVRLHGGDSLRSWRSDLRGENNGFPVFGTPDTVPVYTTFYDEGCERYEWEGTTYTQSGRYSKHHYNDTLLMDSIVTLSLTVHNGTRVVMSDSVTTGHGGYYRNGFSLSDAELLALMANDTLNDVQVLKLADSLLTAHGCDSVVVMSLLVYRQRDDDTSAVGIPDNPEGQPAAIPFSVKVYPNPTMGSLTVESAQMENVEVYDNMSRRVVTQKVKGDKTEIDLSRYSSGAYYVRVTTAQGTAVKKIIKK